jgi:hypothetical protein
MQTGIEISWGCCIALLCVLSVALSMMKLYEHGGRHSRGHVSVCRYPPPAALVFARTVCVTLPLLGVKTTVPIGHCDGWRGLSVIVTLSRDGLQLYGVSHVNVNSA